MFLKLKSDLPLNFWLAVLIALINSICFTIIIPLLYPYAKQFGLNDFQASLLTTSFAISQFFATPILGKLSDRFGRKPLLVISLLGTVVANIVAGWTTVAWVLYAARIIDGLTGGNMSIVAAVIGDTTTPSQRPKAFGIYEAAFRLGFVLGPVLSYLALSMPSFPGVSSMGTSFFLAAAIALLATVLTAFLLTESLPVKQNTQIRFTDFGFGKIIKSAVSPKFGKVFILSFFSGFTFTIFTFAFQPFVLYVLNKDEKTIAILFVITGMLGVIAQVFFLEPLSKRFNIINILAASLAGRGILFLLIPTFPYLGAFFILIGILGIINSFPRPITTSILSLKSSAREQGEVLGIDTSYLSISNALGPAVAGLLVSFGYSMPFWITGALTLLTAWFAFSLKREIIGSGVF